MHTAQWFTDQVVISTRKLSLYSYIVYCNYWSIFWQTQHLELGDHLWSVSCEIIMQNWNRHLKINKIEILSSLNTCHWAIMFVIHNHISWKYVIWLSLTTTSIGLTFSVQCFLSIFVMMTDKLTNSCAFPDLRAQRLIECTELMSHLAPIRNSSLRDTQKWAKL